MKLKYILFIFIGIFIYFILNNFSGFSVGIANLNEECIDIHNIADPKNQKLLDRYRADPAKTELDLICDEPFECIDNICGISDKTFEEYVNDYQEKEYHGSIDELTCQFYWKSLGCEDGTQPKMLGKYAQESIWHDAEHVEFDKINDICCEKKDIYCDTYTDSCQWGSQPKSIKCAGSKCTQEECCLPQPTCVTYTKKCPYDWVKQSDTKKCIGSECTPEECCMPSYDKTILNDIKEKFEIKGRLRPAAYPQEAPKLSNYIYYKLNNIWIKVEITGVYYDNGKINMNTLVISIPKYIIEGDKIVMEYVPGLLKLKYDEFNKAPDITTAHRTSPIIRTIGILWFPEKWLDSIGTEEGKLYKEYNINIDDVYNDSMANDFYENAYKIINNNAKALPIDIDRIFFIMQKYHNKLMKEFMDSDDYENNEEFIGLYIFYKEKYLKENTNSIIIYYNNPTKEIVSVVNPDDSLILLPLATIDIQKENSDIIIKLPENEINLNELDGLYLSGKSKRAWTMNYIKDVTDKFVGKYIWYVYEKAKTFSQETVYIKSEITQVYKGDRVVPAGGKIRVKLMEQKAGYNGLPSKIGEEVDLFLTEETFDKYLGWVDYPP